MGLFNGFSLQTANSLFLSKKKYIYISYHFITYLTLFAVYILAFQLSPRAEVIAIETNFHPIMILNALSPWFARVCQAGLNSNTDVKSNLVP